MASIRRRRITIADIGILLVATTGIIVLAEIIVRALYADETVLFPRYHTDVRYGTYTLRRIRPNSDFRHRSVDGSWRFVTNSAGFRNYMDFSYEKPANVIRVLVLGDSHTQGYEVRQESTYAAVLARYIERNSDGLSAEVINAGVSGFSTAEELLFLENEGTKYHPDVVVLGFYRNDLEDNTKTRLFVLDDQGELQVFKHEHVPGVKIQNVIYSVPGIQWLSEHSYFYSLLFNTTWQYYKARLKQQTTEEFAELAVGMENKFSDYTIDLGAKLIERMYASCQSIGAKLIVVDVPAFGESRPLESSVPPELKPAVLKASDAYIDSVPLFSEFAGAAELHVPHGHRHISEFTHAIIGVSLGQEMRSLGVTVPGALDPLGVVEKR